MDQERLEGGREKKTCPPTFLLKTHQTVGEGYTAPKGAIFLGALEDLIRELNASGYEKKRLGGAINTS